MRDTKLWLWIAALGGALFGLVEFAAHAHDHSHLHSHGDLVHSHPHSHDPHDDHPAAREPGEQHVPSGAGEHHTQLDDDSSGNLAIVPSTRMPRSDDGPAFDLVEVSLVVDAAFLPEPILPPRSPPPGSAGTDSLPQLRTIVLLT